MAIVRWDPFRDVAELRHRINRMFEESFGGSRDYDDEMALCAWRPSVDVYETEDGMVLTAELPGIDKDDVSVEVKDNVLTLKGQRQADPNIKEEQYYRKERCYGTFQRSFTLQQKIQPDRIKATFKDGVLTVEIPGPEEEKPKQVTVTVE